MPITGKDLWRTGVLFELRGPGTTSQVFSLPFAPESFKARVPQRVNRTKTFGGSFEDDYGLDNQAISFSGSMSGTDKWNYLTGDSAGPAVKTQSGPKIL